MPNVKAYATPAQLCNAPRARQRMVSVRYFAWDSPSAMRNFPAEPGQFYETSCRKDPDENCASFRVNQPAPVFPHPSSSSTYSMGLSRLSLWPISMRSVLNMVSENWKAINCENLHPFFPIRPSLPEIPWDLADSPWPISMRSVSDMPGGIWKVINCEFF